MSTDSQVIAVADAEDGTRFRVVLTRDDNAEHLNPRKADVPVGVIFALREAGFPGLRESTSTVSHWDLEDAVQDRSFQAVSRWLRMFHSATVVLPLHHGPNGLVAGDPTAQYAADHYAGVTFDTPLTLTETGMTHDGADRIADALAEDVEIYAEWSRGDVFTWTVQWADVEDETGAFIAWVPAARCPGHIGWDYAVEAARSGLEATVRFHNIDTPAPVGSR